MMAAVAQGYAHLFWVELIRRLSLLCHRFCIICIRHLEWSLVEDLAILSRLTRVGRLSETFPQKRWAAFALKTGYPALHGPTRIGCMLLALSLPSSIPLVSYSCPGNTQDREGTTHAGIKCLQALHDGPDTLFGLGPFDTVVCSYIDPEPDASDLRDYHTLEALYCS